MIIFQYLTVLHISAKNQFFSQLKQFILFRPETRRYEGEVDSFLKKLELFLLIQST